MAESDVIPRVCRHLGDRRWTRTTRAHHSRIAARYQTDLTGAEWTLISALMPRVHLLGRLRERTMREIVNAFFYVLRGGIAWPWLPKDIPPWPTVYRWFARFCEEEMFERINQALVMRDRERVGREASPRAVIIDRQSVKINESGGPRGYDAGKKIKGRKRHALVDIDGRALLIEPHAADVQDRDGGAALLKVSRGLVPFVRLVWADGGYNSKQIAGETNIRVEIVSKIEEQSGFVVLPRRCVVERFFASINRDCRIAKDIEATLKSSPAFLYAAAAMLMIRRLVRVT